MWCLKILADHLSISVKQTSKPPVAKGYLCSKVLAGDTSEIKSISGRTLPVYITSVSIKMLRDVPQTSCQFLCEFH